MSTDKYRVNHSLCVQPFIVGKEKQKILIIDDLVSSPESLINYACENLFDTYSGLYNFYPGIKLKPPIEYSLALMPIIQKIIVSHYEDISSNWEMNKADCSMSLITIKPNELRKVQTVPHIDTANPYQFAILLYLCEQHHGGTAFYRHKATGYESINRHNLKNFENIYIKELDERTRPNNYFTESDEYFEKIGLVNAKYNRMVIYRSHLLHSPYINPISIDSNPKTGRLTVNSFVAFQPF